MACKADGLLSTQIGHSDGRRRFPKAAIRQPSGNLGSGLLSGFYAVTGIEQDELVATPKPHRRGDGFNYLVAQP